MATLNTLRTKMGWLLMVVIGLALIAFLLGDLSSSGSSLFNSSKMQVGEVAGEKVGYEDFTSRFNYYKSIRQMMNGTESLSQEAMQFVKDETWQNIISETIVESTYEDLGLTVSEQEQIDMVSGSYISPVMTNVFVNPQTGLFDAAMLRNFVSNISTDPTGNVDALWRYFKANMNQERVNSKYMTLVNGGMFVTDLQVEQSLSDNQKSYTASYVVQPYSSVADSVVTVSNAEIKEYYNSHLNDYRRSATRDVEYVLFNVIPSEEDYAQAAQTIAGLASEFEATESPLQYAQLNSHRTPDTRYYKESELSGNMAIMASKGSKAEVDGPTLSGTTYTMSRISDVKMLPDSLGAQHILLDPSQAELADSIVKAIKSGASFAALSSQYSLDQAAAAQGGDLGHFAPEQMITEFADAVIASRVKDVFVVTTQFGLHVVQTTFKTPDVKKTQFATVIYEVEPSSYTDQNVYAQATSFIEKAAGSVSNFNAAVNEEALSKRVARIRPTDSDVTGLDRSSEIVRWAYTQAEGDVSDIIKIGDDYIVASLTAVQLDGYAPLEKVASEILPAVRLQKKADLIASQMQGSSLAEVAQAIGEEVETASDITFGSYYIDGVGVEPAFVGAATVSKLGALSKAIKGNTGVYMITVTDAKDQEATSAQDEKIRLQAQASSYISDRATQAIMFGADIKDYRVKFF